MTGARQAVGSWGEDLAARYLVNRGYSILERNARTAYGELDLVATQENQDGSCLVFVEVKTRRSRTLGPPEISVDARKQEHLRAAAQAYLLAHPDLPRDYRIDVIAVRTDGQRTDPEILHFENALTAI